MKLFDTLTRKHHTTINNQKQIILDLTRENEALHKQLKAAHTKAARTARTTTTPAKKTTTKAVKKATR
jgi:predicted phage tail protein